MRPTRPPSPAALLLAPVVLALTLVAAAAQSGRFENR